MMRLFRHVPKTVVLLAGATGFLWTTQSAWAETGGDTPPVILPPIRSAAKWTNLAQLQQFAAQGDPQACFELGSCYLTGDEVSKNSARAIELFSRAAAGGIADASFRLGKIYFDGIEVPVDYARSLGYYTVAAQAGVLEAQHNLGVMLVSAKGVKRDYVEGLAWLIIATKSGAPADVEKQVRARLAKYPDKIQAAESRARELQKDLSHAVVRAELIAPVERPSGPVLPKPAISAPTFAKPEKPVILAPKIEPSAPLVEPPRSGQIAPPSK